MPNNQIVLRSSSLTLTTTRETPRVAGKSTSPAKRHHRKSTSNVGELAGGATANVCLVCCCCPCVVFEFLILAVYKIPATVVRRVWRICRRKNSHPPTIGGGDASKQKKNKNKNKKKILEHAMEVSVVVDGGGGVHVRRSYGGDHGGYADELSDVELREFEKVKVSIDGSAEAVELDKQMWDKFRDAGFWRSPSQRFE